MTDEDYGFSPMERMRAERDAMRERAVAAEQERDRLRRELEALRDEMRALDPYRFVLASEVVEALDDVLCDVRDRIDAVLRGES
jgi:predicted  nucleic acid-binding Zn-ribbon protein